VDSNDDLNVLGFFATRFSSSESFSSRDRFFEAGGGDNGAEAPSRKDLARFEYVLTRLLDMFAQSTVDAVSKGQGGVLIVAGAFFASK